MYLKEHIIKQTSSSTVFLNCFPVALAALGLNKGSCGCMGVSH